MWNGATSNMFLRVMSGMRWNSVADIPTPNTEQISYVNNLRFKPFTLHCSIQTAVPLLLDFHGWTSSAQSQMETESQFHLLAEALGFVAVFVQGTDDSPSGVTSWNIARESGQYGDVCDRDRRVFHLILSLCYQQLPFCCAHSGTTGGCMSATTVALTVTHTPPARGDTPATTILLSLSIWS